ncbi:MAG: stage II sporulation protein M [Gammaproteobacteria bacterium]|nr:stage II sporulation protein M [Gammaproteobacteria bacterium]
MKQSAFENKNEIFWRELESRIFPGSKRKLRSRQLTQLDQHFPEQYRRLCHHLALARSRHYSPVLVNRLEKLVTACHQMFYQRKTHILSSILLYITGGFAQSVRNEIRWVMLSAMLFFGSFLAMLITLQYEPDMVYTVLDGQQIAEMEAMYDPTQDRIGRERQSDTDFQMFGFYIFNNTSIGLRTFASGLLFGVGSVITLLFNGLVIGSVAGYLTFLGYTSSFWSFVAGHSAMELMAIVLSGAAGFKLGFAIISPGRKSRLRSLRDHAREAIYMMYGVALMFFIAAFIEAYWSSITSIAPVIKYTVGILFWILLLLYFVFAGRKRAT